jgi:endonuclease/exonuclease/phosphatase family metal-dependent hydrolase
MKTRLLVLITLFAATSALAQPLKVATWNMAWLANDPLATIQDADICIKQDRAKIDMEKREPDACRKGNPFRLAAGYAGLARTAFHYSFDIIGLQEVQSPRAVALALGDRPLSSGSEANKVPAGTYEVAVNTEGGWQKVGIAVRKALLTPGKNLVATPFKELGEPLARDKRSGLDVIVPLKTGDLRVLVVHLKSACHRVPMDTTDTKNAVDCAALAKQAPIIGKWIADRQEEGKPYMILGDFNRVLTPGAAHEDCAGAANCATKALSASLDKNALTASPILIPTSTAKHAEGCFEAIHGRDLIDHILMGGGAESGYIAASATSHPYVDGKLLPIINKRKAFYFSDHCPVSVQWRP